MIIRADHSAKGENPRFITTSLHDGAAELYETVYCARGEMENPIKEQQLDLFADRTSCHRWWPNQLRFLWSGLAYTLLERRRNDYLYGTQFARAQSGTIRLKLLKIGDVVLRNTRRLRLHLPSAFPHQEIFVTVWNRLARELPNSGTARCRACSEVDRTMGIKGSLAIDCHLPRNHAVLDQIMAQIVSQYPDLQAALA